VTAHAQRSIAYITAHQTGRGSRRADRITMEVIQPLITTDSAKSCAGIVKKWAVRSSEKC